MGRGKYHACRSVWFQDLYRDAAKKMLLPAQMNGGTALNVPFSVITHATTAAMPNHCLIYTSDAADDDAVV